MSSPLKSDSSNHRKKRLDIQGLRTVAILAVVPFHITIGNESCLFFHNGGFGVDIFFLISGYLMAQILSAKPINCPNLVDFYFRRIQRIVPIHLVLLILAIILAQIVLPSKEFKEFREGYLFCLGFATNIDIIIYGPALRGLRHLWSLGVEMQFYLFAPLIVGTIGWLAKKCGGQKRQNFIRILCLSLITVPSFLAQHLTSNTDMAFASLHCRLWQFTLGMAVFFAAKMVSNCKSAVQLGAKMDDSKEEADGKLNTTIGVVGTNSDINWPNPNFLAFSSHACSILLVVLLIFVPIRNRPPLPAVAYNFFYEAQGVLIKMPIILLTVLLLGLHAVVDEKVQSILLTNRIMVHLGDISYILYLVHYPIVLFTKHHFNIKYYGIFDGLAVFVGSIFSAEMLHWLVDSHLRAIKSRGLALKVLVSLYSLCGMQLLLTYFSRQNC